METPSARHNLRVRSVEEFIPIVCAFLLFFIWAAFIIIEGKGKSHPAAPEGDQTALHAAMRLSTEKELPPCIGNLLDKRQFRFARTARGPYDDSRVMVTETGACQLQDYTVERIVNCFDTLRDQQHHPDSSLLQLIFIGDSRMRQQFLNFIRVIPDYDVKSQPSPIPFRYHGDIDVTTRILGIQLSFRWQPIIYGSTVKMISQLANTVPTQQPFLIFLSIEVHHMLTIYKASYNLYEEKLLELAPVLGRLSNVSRVIWLNQYPTVDSYAPNGTHNTEIISEKIHNYNKNVRRILENQSQNIRIWDSGNALVEEYVRSCGVFQRNEKMDYTTKDYSSPYHNCKDYIHSGYSALGQVTQLLYNAICSTN